MLSGLLKTLRPKQWIKNTFVGVPLVYAQKLTDLDALWRLCRELADVVLDAGGRFYYAKDAVLLDSSFARVHGDAAVARFRALKQRWDPDRLLQTDLSRRLGI